ncbi:hypothetical protein F4861DRAFT_108478 [Xylaria intraflava]|nr:hypothetical protein F4861DRAFT_108478 [Xylaria intraflava]
MSHKQTLIPGESLRVKTSIPRTYTTHTIPAFHADSYFLATASPDNSYSSPDEDGWLLSDFYAFNYLERNRGSWGIPTSNCPRLCPTLLARTKRACSKQFNITDGREQGANSHTQRHLPYYTDIMSTTNSFEC